MFEGLRRRRGANCSRCSGAWGVGARSAHMIEIAMGVRLFMSDKRLTFSRLLFAAVRWGQSSRYAHMMHGSTREQAKRSVEEDASPLLCRGPCIVLFHSRLTKVVPIRFMQKAIMANWEQRKQRLAGVNPLLIGGLRRLTLPSAVCDCMVVPVSQFPPRPADVDGCSDGFRRSHGVGRGQRPCRPWGCGSGRRLAVAVAQRRLCLRQVKNG